MVADESTPIADTDAEMELAQPSTNATESDYVASDAGTTLVTEEGVSEVEAGDALASDEALTDSPSSDAVVLAATTDQQSEESSEIGDESEDNLLAGMTGEEEADATIINAEQSEPEQPGASLVNTASTESLDLTVTELCSVEDDSSQSPDVENTEVPQEEVAAQQDEVAVLEGTELLADTNTLGQDSSEEDCEEVGSGQQQMGTLAADGMAFASDSSISRTTISEKQLA